MSDKEPRHVAPPDLIGPLSPKNSAWYWTQVSRGTRSQQLHAEAIARQQGFVRDELGNFVVPQNVELTLEGEE